jgi:tetratricopeptide (TPR) repeat protein
LPPPDSEIVDRFALTHTTASPAAVRAFGEAVEAIAGHRPNAAEALDRALHADPMLVTGHILKGFCGVVLARGETMIAARHALTAARAALAAQELTSADEQTLVAALAEAVEGRLRAAADRLAERLSGNPYALLLVKLVHSLRFMLGDVAGMRAVGEAILPAWSPGRPGYGFVLGCHAFALEESGELKAAERVGREAVAHEPRDAWGLHAVAHVFEMTGRIADGIAWLEEKRESWSDCNNFAFHLAWHLALFHLEGGRHDHVLDLYDKAVRPLPTDDFRDVANASSLLWRLRQEGVEVGHRWDELAAIAHRRRDETVLVFATLHYLLALVADGDLAAAADLVGSLEMRAMADTDDQAVVAATVGLPIARAIISLAQGGPKRRGPELAALVHRLPQLGGSHAQRDVFVRTLAELAAREGDLPSLRAILALRQRLKREDRFGRLLGVEPRGTKLRDIPGSIIKVRRSLPKLALGSAA